MNIEKIFLKKNLHHFYLPPREKGEEPLIVDFYPPALNNAITMPLSTLEEFVIYLENPTSRIVYNSVNNRDLEIPLEPGETPFIQIDEDRSLCYNGTGFYLEKYSSKEKRDNDEAAYYRLLSGKDIVTPQLQIPEMKSVFDYNGAFYIVLRVRRKALGKTEGVLWRGMVVKPPEYENQ
jgi:hypothetical protein